MRKYPEIHVEWTPASGSNSQLLEINVNGLTPSGSYVTQYLTTRVSEWHGFIPLWDKEGKVWSREHKTNEVHVNVTAINELDGYQYKSDTISSTLIVDDLPWIPESPTELTVTLSSFRYEVRDVKMDQIEVNIRDNLA
jgi:hypothetical protein